MPRKKGADEYMASPDNFHPVVFYEMLQAGMVEDAEEAAKAYLVAHPKNNGAVKIIRICEEIKQEGTASDNLRIAHQLIHAQKKPTEARPILEKILSRFPENAIALYMLGQTYEVEDPPRALELFDSSLKFNPHISPVISAAGVCCKMGEWRQAAQYYEEALKIKPLDSEARNGRYKCYMKSGDLKSIIKLAQKELKDSPNDFLASTWLVRALIETRKGPEAEVAARQFLMEHNKDKIIRHELGKALLMQKKNDEAYAVFNALWEDNKEPEVLMMTGKAKMEAGKLDEAEKIFRQCLDIKPGDIKTLTNLGDLYLRRKNYEVAISVFLEVLKKEPKSWYARYFLAKAYYLGNKMKEGKKVITDLVQSTNFNPGALYLFACFYTPEDPIWQMIEAAFPTEKTIIERARRFKDNLGALQEEEANMVARNTFWDDDSVATQPVNRAAAEAVGLLPPKKRPTKF